LQDELLSIQRQLRKTILFVTHDVDEALRLADKIIVMRKGRIIQFDTPLTILTQPSDEFVGQLVNADDMLRHLSLIKVKSVISAAQHDARADAGGPRISVEDDLRSALSLLLSAGTESLAVVDDRQQVLGHLTFDTMQHVLRSSTARVAGV
jgi:osmoprotectant transport system ATP-binding protein